MPVARITHPTLTTLTRAVLSHTPSGNTLDQAVLTWQPTPGMISHSPSANVLDHLARQRNLYSESLKASTTTTPHHVINSTHYQKTRVRRALALNPNLTIKQAHELGNDAHTRRDSPLLLALIERSPYFADILTGTPKLLSMLSLRTGQPGPPTLGARLNDLEPYEAPELANSIYRKPRATSTQRTTHSHVMNHAISHYLDLIARDQIQPNLPTLVAMSSTLIPEAVLGKRQLQLPRTYIEQIEQLPGRDILSLTQVLDIAPLDHANPAPDTDLAKASNATLENIRNQPTHPNRSQAGSEIRHWTPTALEIAGTWIAHQITEFGQLHTLNVLSHHWTGTLDELVTASLNL